MVNTTLNRFGKKLPPVKTGQRFGEEIKKDKKVGLFSERRFLIFTKRGPIEIAFKPIHYASVIMTTIIGLTSIVYWSAKGIHSAIDVAKKNDIITVASANISNPIENDSDTVVNINTNDQSNISLPVLKNNFSFEENDTISYKPMVDKNIIKKEEFVGVNLREINNQTTANNLNIVLFNETMRNQDLPISFTNQLENESNIFAPHIPLQHHSTFCRRVEEKVKNFSQSYDVSTKRHANFGLSQKMAHLPPACHTKFLTVRCTQTTVAIS